MYELYGFCVVVVFCIGVEQCFCVFGVCFWDCDDVCFYCCGWCLGVLVVDGFGSCVLLGVGGYCVCVVCCFVDVIGWCCGVFVGLMLR